MSQDQSEPGTDPQNPADSAPAEPAATQSLDDWLARATAENPDPKPDDTRVMGTAAPGAAPGATAGATADATPGAAPGATAGATPGSTPGPASTSTDGYGHGAASAPAATPAQGTYFGQGPGFGAASGFEPSPLPETVSPAPVITGVRVGTIVWGLVIFALAVIVALAQLQLLVPDYTFVMLALLIGAGLTLIIGGLLTARKERGGRQS